MREVGAGERFGVGARELAARAGVVAARGADGIGELIGGVAGDAGAYPAPAGRLGFFRAHTGEKTGATHAALRHHVAGGDEFGDAAGAGVVDLLAEIEVFAPERGGDGLALANECGGLPAREIEPGFVGIECENRGIGGQGGGAEVTPTTRGAAIVGGLVAEFETGFE